VSSVAGTTTDPVEKPMELLPLGPVLFIDTAGIDDEGALGALRVQKTRQVLERADLGVLVTEAGAWGKFEEEILGELRTRGIPAIVVINKIDAVQAAAPSSADLRPAVAQTSSLATVQMLRTAPPHRSADASSACSSETATRGRGARAPKRQPEQLPSLQGVGGGQSIKPVPGPADQRSALRQTGGLRYGSTIPEAALAEQKTRVVRTSALNGAGILDLRQALLDSAPADFIDSPAIVGDLVGPGELAVLVVPIDKEAPKGRLILPQVQAIRDLLDSDAYCLVVKERELRSALDRLKTPPRLVVTDSQAFLKVAADTPRSVPLTSFSILMSRFKGDLLTQVEGALAIDRLRAGDRVLVAEACAHHPIGEDIGRVKIPRWLTQYVGGKLEFKHVQGHDFPEDLSPYKLVVHCGACMWNRREMLSRLLRCHQAGVPITNYGLTIAYSLGIFERALEPFPAALESWKAARTGKGIAD
jgi:small GTP-binding protein